MEGSFPLKKASYHRQTPCLSFFKQIRVVLAQASELHTVLFVSEVSAKSRQCLYENSHHHRHHNHNDNHNADLVRKVRST